MNLRSQQLCKIMDFIPLSKMNQEFKEFRLIASNQAVSDLFDFVTNEFIPESIKRETAIHDILGIANREECFSPRSYKSNPVVQDIMNPTHNEMCGLMRSIGDKRFGSPCEHESVSNGHCTNCLRRVN